MDDAFQRRIAEYASSLQDRNVSCHSSVKNMLTRRSQRGVNKQSIKEDSAAPAADPSTTTNETVAAAPPKIGGLLRKRRDPLDDEFRKKKGVVSSSNVEATFEDHWSFRRLSEMSDVSWEAMRQEYGIEIEAHSFRSAGGLFGLHSSSVHPARCWDEVAVGKTLRSELLLAYLNKHYAFPSPIQSQCLPIVLRRANQSLAAHSSSPVVGEGKLDLLGVAETGSGKTLCYLLPAIEHIIFDESPMTPERAQYGPLALILVPTRELAEQVFNEVQRMVAFAKDENVRGGELGDRRCCGVHELRAVKLIGGESSEEQHDAISKGVHLAVGTPGQLASLLSQRYLSLGNTRFVAVDEADRMVEEQMTDQLCSVLEHCPTPRHTVMFTATMVPECQTIALKFLSPRGYFVVKTPYLFESVWQTFELFPVSTVTSSNHEVDGAVASSVDWKLRRLAQWASYHSGPIIVFANEKSTCDRIARYLRELSERCLKGIDEVQWDATGDKEDPTNRTRSDWLESKRNDMADFQQLSRVVVVHSGMSQTERRNTVQRFQQGQVRILVTTDLLARGLDVKGLDLIVNFELPEVPRSSSINPEVALTKYIHRIGRTGRAGRRGHAVSFVTLNAADVLRCHAVANTLDAQRTQERRLLNQSVTPNADGNAQNVGVLLRRLEATVDDEEDVVAAKRAKRDREDDDAEDEGDSDKKVRVFQGDLPVTAPLFRFLRDCAMHSSLQVKSEEQFVEFSRKKKLDRFTIPEPLLLVMKCEAQHVSNGTILR